MKLHQASLALAAMTLCGASFAASGPYRTVDHSNASLMDDATAKAIWKEAMPVQTSKLYPASKWGGGSSVSGGFTADKTCVITAQAMLLPVAGKSLLYKPEKQATTFGVQAGATEAQCKDLAKAKLKEAIEAIGSSLVSK